MHAAGIMRGGKGQGRSAGVTEMAKHFWRAFPHLGCIPGPSELAFWHTQPGDHGRRTIAAAIIAMAKTCPRRIAMKFERGAFALAVAGGGHLWANLCCSARGTDWISQDQPFPSRAAFSSFVNVCPQTFLLNPNSGFGGLVLPFVTLPPLFRNS